MQVEWIVLERIRRQIQGLFCVVALVVATSLSMLAGWIPAATTPRGVQCPTAAVQKVIETKWVKNCCGKWVQQEVSRAPREGEKDFKQCRCAEKSDAEKRAEARATETRPSVVTILHPLTARTDFSPLARIKNARMDEFAAGVSSVPHSPIPPPPRAS